MSLLLLLAAQAHAADTLLYYNSTYYGMPAMAALDNALIAAGASVSTSTSTAWPTDYTGYKLVILVAPEKTFSAAQASALTNFVNAGGRLVVAGEYGSYPTMDNTINSLMSSMGVSMSLNKDTLNPGGCGRSTTINADQVTTGVGHVYLSATSSIAGGTSLIEYGGSRIVAYAQPSSSTHARTAYDVVLLGDTNLLTANGCGDETSAGSNYTFWYNLYIGCDDADGDGYTDETCGGDDCDDTDAAVNPGATEECNGIDDDCDGDVDESGSTETRWYRDTDGDDYGDPFIYTDACDQPPGYVDNDDDCDDHDADVYPGAPETPYDGVDQDCDGADLIDVDGDGYTASEVGGPDCADADASVHPYASETADGVDDDCNDIVDDTTIWYDDDGDGYTEAAGDCDDTSADVHPGATEVENGVDDDCDYAVDDGTAAYDDDGDGYSEEDGDCNDADASIHPGASESATDGVDDDCDGTVDDGLLDDDGDGYTPEGGDCAPTDPDVHPGATETANGVDDDCDGVIDEGTSWYDDDGDGWTEKAGDCDDADPAVNPDAEETENGRDDDCDGDVDEDTDRTDDDGDGYSEDGGDCDDGASDVSPGAEEQAGNGIDDDCDGDADEGGDDLDGDGYSEADGDCDDDNGWIHPGLVEVCDGLDNNCDGVADETCADTGLGKGTDDGTGCNCATAAGPTAAAWATLVALSVLGRRRR